MSFLSNLFGGGGGTPQVQPAHINFNPQGFYNPGGFSVSAGGGVSESPTLASNIGSLQGTFGAQAGALGGLASTVQPGFSQFRKAGLQDITNAFRSNLSSLKQNLAQRGIAGSSFANDSISQAYATEAQNKADFEAQSYIEELNAQYQLIQSQYQAQSQQFSTAINQSNIESGAAASLIATNNQIGAQIATANAQLVQSANATNAGLTAQAQQGAGSFLGSLIGAGASLGGSYMQANATNALAAALLA